MKTMKILSLLIFSIFILTGFADAQTNTNTTKTKSIRKQFPQVTVATYGGAIFPLPKILNQTFKPGGNLAVDVGYRINKEVGIYGKFGYSFMASKLTGAPVGSYLEVTVGPRYYFMHPKLNSAIFLEGGVGAYNFRQNSYTNPGDTTGAVISQINNIKAGLNGGIGANLALSDAVDILFKSKYNVVFTPNGTTSFITVGGGLEFRFR